MKFYVYLFINKIDGIPFYVGKGCGHRCSPRDHLRAGEYHLPCSRKIRKIGEENVELLFLLKTDYEEIAFERERFWISKIGRRDIGTGPLLNLNDGGKGGTSPSSETRRKISQAHRGKRLTAEHKSKIGDSHRGMKRTQSTKDNISKAKKGVPLVKLRGAGNPMATLKEKQVLKIRKMYETNKYTLRAIAEKFNVSESTIFKIIKRLRWTHI